MNLLIFVTVLLMVLTSLSYSQIKIFYRQSLTHAAWVRYMDTIEGCLYNNQIDAVYGKLPKKKGPDETATDSLGHQIDKEEAKTGAKKSQSTGSKRINFRILLGKTKKLTPDEADQFHSVIKNLIAELYGNTNFYKEYLEKRPTFVDEILSALTTEFKDKKIKRAKEIEKLVLKDPELNEAFYFMIKDNPDESQEKNPCAQFSLLDFFTDSPRTAIRVFLAPREILLAAFKDPQIVDQILEKRQELFKDVDDRDVDPKKATEEFEQAFQGYSPYRDILDFSVTKVNPESYK